MIEIINEKIIGLSKLERAVYKDCTLENCDLSKQNFNNFEFIDCKFLACNLSNADVSGTSFKDVIFKFCKLIGVHFEFANPFLIKMEFEECNLNYSSFFKLKIPKTKFIKSSIQEVDFTEANLKESIFDYCDLSMSKFENSNLEKVDFYTSFGYTLNPLINNIKKARFSKNEIVGLLSDFNIVISE